VNTRKWRPDAHDPLPPFYFVKDDRRVKLTRLIHDCVVSNQKDELMPHSASVSPKSRRKIRPARVPLQSLEPRLLLAAQLFITNASSGTIGEYSSTGATLNASLLTGLSSPGYLANSGSNLFVVGNTFGAYKIGEYSTAGATVNAALVPSGLNAAGGIAASGATLFVVDQLNESIHEYNTAGTLLAASLIPGLDGLGSIAISGSTLYIPWFDNAGPTFGNWIGAFSTGGTAINSHLISLSNPNNGIAVSGSNIFITNLNGTVSEYTTGGTTVNASLITGLTNPQAIAVSGSDLFVASSRSGTGVIGEYTTAGATVNAALISNLDLSSSGLVAVTPNTAPKGWIDSATAAKVSGWAFDADAGAASIQVRIDVDGIAGTPFTASLSRPDLTASLGSPNHGFSFTMPSLSPGLHKVELYALDSTTSAPKLVASKELNTNGSPTGWIDILSPTTLAGWAYDPNTPSASIQLRYQIDTNAPQLLTASLTRPDLAGPLGSTNHGFSITLPQLTAGTHKVTVWLVDSTTDSLTSMGARSLIISNPTGNLLPKGHVDLLSATAAAGWAYDPSNSPAAVQIRIDIDGVIGTPFAANLARPDLVATIGSKFHGFSHPLSLTPGAHKIDIYALDLTTATPTLLTSQIVNDPAPRGFLDSLTQSSAQGWAFLPALGSSPATVRLDIDGIPTAIVTASLSRPDLTATLGSPDHGFFITLPKLLAGSHSIKLYLLDPITLTPTLLASKTLIAV